jgi:DNA polymerase III delta prime subunit
MDRNIDTLRNTIMDYGSKVSMFGGLRKYIILDEADYLNPTSMQPALRGAMEELSVNCGFILTCNFKNKIMEPLQGRCSIIDFKEPKGDEKKDLLKQSMVRFGQILDNESIPYDKTVLLKHIQKYFPNFRKTLNELQAYAKMNGSVDLGLLNNHTSNYSDLIAALKEKQFTNMRQWVGENASTTIEDISKYFYDHALELFAKESIPQLVLHLSEYDYKSQFVVNKEITIAAMLTAIMSDVEMV